MVNKRLTAATAAKGTLAKLSSFEGRQASGSGSPRSRKRENPALPISGWGKPRQKPPPLKGLRGVEWAIFVWIMPESCAFPRFFALRARLEIAMILDGKN